MLLTGGEPLLATLGMTTDEAARHASPWPALRGQPARAVRIGYTYTHEEIRDESDLIRGGVSIPLRDSEGERIGTLAVFWWGEARPAAALRGSGARFRAPALRARRAPRAR